MCSSPRHGGQLVAPSTFEVKTSVLCNRAPYGSLGSPPGTSIHLTNCVFWVGLGRGRLAWKLRLRRAFVWQSVTCFWRVLLPRPSAKNYADFIAQPLFFLAMTRGPLLAGWSFPYMRTARGPLVPYIWVPKVPSLSHSLGCARPAEIRVLYVGLHAYIPGCPTNDTSIRVYTRTVGQKDAEESMWGCVSYIRSSNGRNFAVGQVIIVTSGSNRGREVNIQKCTLDNNRDFPEPHALQLSCTRTARFSIVFTSINS